MDHAVAGSATNRQVSAPCARFRAPTGGELAVTVADQEPKVPVGVVEVHDQVARQLGQPRSGRLGGDAQHVYSAGGVLDDGPLMFGRPSGRR
jgi:hypothetical protein